MTDQVIDHMPVPDVEPGFEPGFELEPARAEAAAGVARAER